MLLFCLLFVTRYSILEYAVSAIFSIIEIFVVVPFENFFELVILQVGRVVGLLKLKFSQSRDHGATTYTMM